MQVQTLSTMLSGQDDVVPAAPTPFSDFIKIIGRGKKSGKYLSLKQAEEAMTQIIRGEVAAEQVGAFLMLLRVREESAEELAGFVLAFRAHLQLDLTQKPDLDLGCYAGKRRHLPWLVGSLLLLAQQGYRCFVHAGQEPQSTRLYLTQVWQAFGWQTVSNGQQADNQLQRYGFCLMDVEQVSPVLHQQLQLRSLFGLRSCINTVARMLNPCAAKMSLHGVFHEHFDERHIQVAELLGDTHVGCFRGEGGEIEVNPERPFTLHLIRASQVHQQPLVFPELLPSWQIKPRALDPQAVRRVWCGQQDDEYGKAAIIGTCAVALSLLEERSPESALARASTLWNNRDRKWPILMNHD